MEWPLLIAAWLDVFAVFRVLHFLDLFGISDKKCIRKQDGLVCQIRPTYQGYLTCDLDDFQTFFTQVSSGKWSSNLSMQFCVCWRICSFAGDGTIYYLDRLFRAQLGSRVHFLTCLRPDSHDVQVFQIQTALVFFWGMLKSYHFDLAYLAVAKYDKASLDHWRLENESRWPSWALKLESGVQFLQLLDSKSVGEADDVYIDINCRGSNFDSTLALE